MPHQESASFRGPAQTHSFAALLFDMDGTIIDSTPAIVKFWMGLGEQIGVPGKKILETSHGRRSIDVLQIIAPQLANWDFICEAEGNIPLKYGNDAVQIPGSRELLAKLDAVPTARWAIVTSGTRRLVQGWLDVMKLAQPRVLVTAEEVPKGKPDPAPYLLGSKRLGLDGDIDGNDILVLEDAPSGIRAGKAAGFKVLALATTHPIEQLKEAGADVIVEDMRSVTMKDFDAKTATMTLEFWDTLVDE